MWTRRLVVTALKVGVDSDCAPTAAAAARTSVAANGPTRETYPVLLVMASTLPSLGPGALRVRAMKTPSVAPTPEPRSVKKNRCRTRPVAGPGGLHPVLTPVNY